MNPLSVLICVSLASLMAGCAKTPPVTVTEYRYADLPERFLAECPVTVWSEGGSYRDLGKLAAARRVDLDLCNAQLQEAREFQKREAENRL